MPTPGRTRNFLTSGSWASSYASPTQPTAFDTMAAEIGCADFISNAAANVNGSTPPESALFGAKSCTTRTANSPFVSVPVLSRPAAVMEGNASTVSAFLMSRPRVAAAAIAQVVAKGAPITIAQGQAVSRITKPRSSQVWKSPLVASGTSVQTTSTTNRTKGVQIRANLSSINCLPVLCICASCTFASSCERVESDCPFDSVTST
mmetsp:Transcript_28746/g.68365  ORF Transcript_28746/g.68365 Transcript_28746/m.68365 type:complete len:205 (-) Transcript_28746:1617-2231(-)